VTTPFHAPQHRDHRILARLCLLLALLQVFDLHSTFHAAHNGRSETNPVLLWVISRIGFTPAMIVSKAAALFVIGVYYGVVSRFGRMLWPSISLVPVCGVYIAIVLNNYS